MTSMARQGLHPQRHDIYIRSCFRLWAILWPHVWLLLLLKKNIAMRWRRRRRHTYALLPSEKRERKVSVYMGSFIIAIEWICVEQRSEEREMTKYLIYNSTLYCTNNKSWILIHYNALHYRVTPRPRHHCEMWIYKCRFTDGLLSLGKVLSCLNGPRTPYTRRCCSSSNNNNPWHSR